MLFLAAGLLPFWLLSGIPSGQTIHGGKASDWNDVDCVQARALTPFVPMAPRANFAREFQILRVVSSRRYRIQRRSYRYLKEKLLCTEKPIAQAS